LHEQRKPIVKKYPEVSTGLISACGIPMLPALQNSFDLPQMLSE
jgi:hypothetical protein